MSSPSRSEDRTQDCGHVRWQVALKTALRDPLELCQRLELPVEYWEGARQAAELFPVFAPLGYVARMRKGDPSDPLLRQVLPLADELMPSPGFGPDPVGDRPAQSEPGVLRKYHGRALLVTTGACAVHCRYCFRRHFPYDEVPAAPADWQPALDRLAADPTVDEVLLSGGDPWTLVDDRLAALTERIAAIPHIQRLRVHTRLPIIIPERVTSELLDVLTGTRLTTIVVVHANHAQEIDDSVAAALARLIDRGIPVLNQTVLLRGVNDSAEAFEQLARRLINCRVLPYYLHQLDRVAGAAHFEVAEADGLAWMEELRRRLPGYAVPRYVREVPGDSSKRELR